jgi:hypothetical protein
MPDIELTQEVIDVSTRLIDASREGEIEGKDVAVQIDRPDTDLYYAFQEAKRQEEEQRKTPSKARRDAE